MGGDTFAAARSIGKAATLYEKAGEKSKAAMAYVAMAGVELKAQAYEKVEDYVTKAKAMAPGDSKVLGAAAEISVDVAVSKDDIHGALASAKEVIGIFHAGGEMKSEIKALDRLACLYLKFGYHEKAAKVAEMGLGVAYGLNDTEAMASLKKALDDAKHTKVCEEIEVTIAKYEDYIRMPSTPVIVDPELQTRMQSKYIDAVKGR